MSDYESALARYETVGASKADDADLMAGFCRYDVQLIAGAASPKLVWEGAQSKGLSTRELANLSPRSIEDLMWV